MYVKPLVVVKTKSESSFIAIVPSLLLSSSGLKSSSESPAGLIIALVRALTREV